MKQNLWQENLKRGVTARAPQARALDTLHCFLGVRHEDHYLECKRHSRLCEKRPY